MDGGSVSGLIESRSPPASGQRANGAQRLSDEFDEQFRRRWHSAAQLVLLHRGRVVLERAAGLTGGGQSDAVTPQSPFLVCSIGKPLLALCIHHLADRGSISLGDRIGRYWPAFSARGKDSATIRHALLHQLGLAKTGLLRQLLGVEGQARGLRRLEQAVPTQVPGTRTAYHPLNYGLVLSEVLRRVSGMTAQAYLKQHFLDPMGLQRTTWRPTEDELRQSPRMVAAHPSQWASAFAFNRVYVRRMENPGFNLHSTARELAAVFQMLVNGGSYLGRQYLRPETVTGATALRFQGMDHTVRRTTLWAEGFHLGGWKREHANRPGPAMGARSSTRTFGHCGHMSSIVWADPDADMVFAFTCNGLLSPRGAASRWQRLADRAWEAVGEPPTSRAA